MKGRVPVSEIMSASPVTVQPDVAVNEAAELMREHGIGSLVVVESGKPSGIVTERDIVTKVAAKDRRGSDVEVQEIMTTPVVAIRPEDEVVEAARIMSDRKIRRLAVVKDGRLIGILTENDIVRIWPHLIEVTREYARLGLDQELKAVEGHCEVCGVYSDSLVFDKKLLACPDCQGR